MSRRVIWAWFLFYLVGLYLLPVVASGVLLWAAAVGDLREPRMGPVIGYVGGLLLLFPSVAIATGWPIKWMWGRG